MDFFHDIDEIRDSFKKFAHKLPEDGLLVLNGEIDDISYIVEGLKAKYVTYGIDNDDFTYTAKNISYDSMGHGHFDLYKEGTFVDSLSLNVNGLHNINNALSAAAVADFLGLSIDTVKAGLLTFSGAKRRFEYKGTCQGFTVIDDYAHHPTEIKATLNACKNYPHKDLWCVFQPHTYTRTNAFLDEFAEALSQCDHVIITDIYAARERDTGMVHARDLADKIEKTGTDVRYIKDFDEIEEFILKKCKKNDLLITMGAGNVDSIGNELVKK